MLLTEKRELAKTLLKGRVHCFSMQVVMNKCFLPNPEKNWRKSVLSFSRKTEKCIFNSEKLRHPAEC